MINMAKKFVVEVNFNHYTESIGYLVEAENENEANGIVQRAFLNSHPNESILHTRVIEITVTLINSNPSSRNPEEKA
jgi:hypothetical protein